MKKRIVFLLLIFLSFWGGFLLQKPLFMLYNGAIGKGTALADYFRVLYHGASLDAATAGYLTAIPWLVILISFWLKRVPLRKILGGYYLLIALIVSCIGIADMSLYPFWGFKLDASIFQYLDSPKNAMASAVTPQKLEAARQRLAGTGLTLLLGGVLFIIIRGGVTESTSNIGQAYFCNDEFLNHSAVNPAFSLLASAGKTQKYEEMFDFFPEEERKSLFEGLYPTQGENTVELLNTRRPNILVILMEGFGGVFVEPLGGVPDVSPNLNRLAKEGIFFTNCYANSFRTDRGTLCTFSGYQSFPTLSVMKIPAKSRTLPALAEKLVKEGYQTDFLYGGDINFTNMKSYLLGSGYQKLTADTDFPLSQKQNAWGLYNVLKERKNGPWHTAFLTLSSHEPFEVPYHRLNENIPNAFAFTDDCLGKFIDRMKQLPQWKDLLIICLPDHGFYYPREGFAQSPRIHHIPMLWLGGAVKQPMVVDKLMNQTDLVATLLGQLGMEHQEFNFSRNVLYYTYNNGVAFIDSTGVTVLDNNSGQTVMDEPVPSERRLKLGKAILQSSYDDLGRR